MPVHFRCGTHALVMEPCCACPLRHLLWRQNPVDSLRHSNARAHTLETSSSRTTGRALDQPPFSALFKLFFLSHEQQLFFFHCIACLALCSTGHSNTAHTRAQAQAFRCFPTSHLHHRRFAGRHGTCIVHSHTLAKRPPCPKVLVSILDRVAPCWCFLLVVSRPGECVFWFAPCPLQDPRISNSLMICQPLSVLTHEGYSNAACAES